MFSKTEGDFTKFSVKLLCCSLLVVSLSGCSFQDGSYSAVTSGFDSLGYQTHLNITVTDGAISSVEFDSYDSSGNLKSENADYARLMKPVCGITPKEISDYYEQLLIGKKSRHQVEVDAVSGATVSSLEFSHLWEALSEPLRKGTPSQVTLSPTPEYLPSAPNE